MKIVLILGASLLSIVSCLAEVWTTNDGKFYSNVKVVKFDPVTVTILTQDGEVGIPLATLSPEIQKRFNGNAAASQPSSPSVADQELARNTAQKSAVFIDGLVTSKDADGALLIDCNAPQAPSGFGSPYSPANRINNNSFQTYQNTVSATGNADAAQGRRAHGTVFLLHAGNNLNRGDEISITAYPAGKHTDRLGTFHAYSATLP
jgi:hypothetical protein